jgi:hypothetical protein
MTISRGPDLPKSGERWRRRRIRKSPCQASGPASGTTVEYPVKADGLIKAVNRLAYALRRNVQSQRSVRKTFYCLAASTVGKFFIKPLAPDMPPASVALSHGHHKRAPPSRKPGLRGKPVHFVRETKPHVPVVIPYHGGLPRPSGGVLRFRSVPQLGFSPLVEGTFLENKKLRDYRAIQRTRGRKVGAMLTSAEAKEFTTEEVMRNLTPGRYDPAVEGVSPGSHLALVSPGEPLNLPKPRISRFEVQAAVNSMTDDAFVEHVKKEASKTDDAALMALLAGESWGVMKF